jgi:hypothetical protein
LRSIRKLVVALLVAPVVVVHVARAEPSGGVERDWTGTYAVRLRMVTETHLPMLLGQRQSVTTSLAIAQVRRTATGWVQEQRACDVQIQADTPMKLGAALVAGMPAARFPVAFPAGDREYAADMGVQAIGYDPAATGGALPDRADAPGVVDTDHDGRPGATVTGHFPLFGSVDIYFAQRLHLALRGRETRPGRIAGRLDVRELQQRTLGASSRFFRRTLPVTAEPEASSFVMVAVPAGFTCEDLRRADASLFR